MEEAQWTDGVSEEERKEMKKIVVEVIDNCQVFYKYKRNPAKPVVCFSWGKAFSEVIAIDIGEIEGRRFLVMVDMMTRYCQAKWIKDKRPESIITIHRWVVCVIWSTVENTFRQWRRVPERKNEKNGRKMECQSTNHTSGIPLEQWTVRENSRFTKREPKKIER